MFITFQSVFDCNFIMEIHLSKVFRYVRFLALSFFFSLIFINGYSQQLGFKTAKSFISEESSQTSIQNQNEFTSGKSLIEDLHSSVYLENGSIKIYGLNPKCLFVSTLPDLGNVSGSFTKDYIEIVTIKILTVSELSQPLDLTIFSEYQALRIIYILLPFECNVDQLNNFIQNQTTNYHLIYTIEKPS